MQLPILVEKFQQKDIIAFEALYNMYGKSIHGVIYNIVRDYAAADDILQDVFVKVWNNSSNYSTEKGRFFTWLLTIARKAALDKIHSKTINPSEHNLNKQCFADIIETNEFLNTENDGLDIKVFVSKLANSCIDVIELIYFKGYNQKETSESLDMPISTIKTRNRNCMMQLRLMLNI
ncbi:sigma-70 family RNA polymerase sigma factor [Yeosuana marina]|uniref:RNA polymerase sigma factor n=1 Tax=Yeosuana marina TaxID=1565536 RepID=UPI0030EF2E4F|tara:strand:- start:444 stop:974 length:531 start_codon:yes stop_codon:yes gene_type:complete